MAQTLRKVPKSKQHRESPILGMGHGRSSKSTKPLLEMHRADKGLKKNGKKPQLGNTSLNESRSPNFTQPTQKL